MAGGGYPGGGVDTNTTLQLLVDEHMRGKVIALYLMGLTGTVPLGNLIQGWATEAVGPRSTVVVGGARSLAVTFWLATSPAAPPHGRLTPASPRWTIRRPRCPLTGHG